MKDFIFDFYNPDIKVLFLFILVLAVLYFSFRSGGRKKGALSIFLLRSIVLLLTLFIFLKPVVKWEKSIQNKPVVEFWLDNSQSILQNQSVQQSSLIKDMEKAQTHFEKKGINRKLIAFDSHYRQLDSPGELTFDGESTNLSQLMAEKKIDAAILISDGQINAGQDLYKMQWTVDYPIYTIGIGDTTKKFDARVDNLSLPGSAREGDVLNITAEVTLPPEAGNTTIQLLKNDEIIQSRLLNPDEDAFMQNITFQLTADEVGENEFTVLLENESDKNSHNNAQTSLINILPGEREVLILCGAPSFETRSLMTIFKGNKDFNATVVYFRKGKFYPDEKALQKKYNLVIMSHYPAKSMTMKELQQIQAIFNDNALPVIIYINHNSDLNRLNNLVQRRVVGNYTVKTVSTLVEEFQQHAGHAVLRDVTADLEWLQLPPIQYDFSKLELHTSFKSLLTTSKLNEKPVVAISDEFSAAMFIGVDFWRWQMMTESTNYSQILLNTVNYLTTENEITNIQISPQKKLFMVGETVSLSGLVYDLRGQAVPDASVSIVLKKDSVLVDEFYLNWHRDNFQGEYLIKKPGAYTMDIEAMSDGHSIGKKTIEIKALERILEFTETGQNRTLLNYVTKESGGEMITLDQLDPILGTIKKDQPIKYEKREINFYNNKLIFGLFLGLLVIEWIIRKYFGHL